MNRIYIAFIVAVLVIVVGAVWYSISPSPETSQEVPTQGQSIRVEARLGQGVQALGETITVLRVLEDSRCPLDVQCIQAGTVRAAGTVLGGMGLGQLTFELGTTNTSEVNAFTLVEVRPDARAGESIAEPDYVFVFDVVRR